ncbi:MAG: hypothetical protein ABSG16_23190 [Candidatus Acidiferrum sp.]|jgi:hypothetical protein
MNALLRPSFQFTAAALACTFASLAMTLFAASGRAHNGPPFPIITDQRVGPCVVSLWIHPDIGNSPIFVLVDPPPGGAVPKDLKIEIGIQPVSGRLPEVLYPMSIADQRGQLEYKTEVQFDRQEFWKVRLILSTSAGGGESAAEVEATPLGYGRWDLLLFALPFLAVGFLWFKLMAKRRRRKGGVQPASFADTSLP